MIRALDLEDVREEVWSKANVESLDYAWSLWLATREIDDCELLIWLKTDKVRSKDNTRLLSLVVIDLNS